MTDDNTIALTLLLDLQRQVLTLRARVAELEAMIQAKEPDGSRG